MSGMLFAKGARDDDDKMPRKNLAEGKTRGNIKNPESTMPRPPAPKGQGGREPLAVMQSVNQLLRIIGLAGQAVAAERMSEVKISVTVKHIPGKRGEVEIIIDAPPELMSARGRV